MEWKVEVDDVDVGLEAVDLAAVAVALHRDVDGPEVALVGSAVEHLRRQQNHSRAGAEDRQAVAEHRLDVVVQSGCGQQPRHRRALAAGHDQRVEAGEVTRLAHLPSRRAGSCEGALMRSECALQCQHTDEPMGPAPVGHGYQPRSAYR